MLVQMIKKTNLVLLCQLLQSNYFRLIWHLDSLHWIQGEYVRLSSFEDEIKSQGLNFSHHKFKYMMGKLS